MCDLINLEVKQKTELALTLTMSQETILSALQKPLILPNHPQPHPGRREECNSKIKCLDGFWRAESSYPNLKIRNMMPEEISVVCHTFCLWRYKYIKQCSAVNIKKTVLKLYCYLGESSFHSTIWIFEDEYKMNCIISKSLVLNQGNT